MLICIYIETDRQTDRQTETDRQTDRGSERERQTDRANNNKRALTVQSQTSFTIRKQRLKGSNCCSMCISSVLLLCYVPFALIKSGGLETLLFIQPVTMQVNWR